MMRGGRRSRRLRAGAVLAAALLAQVATPPAIAAPGIPDIDSLIDDSGPLPATEGDLGATHDLLFTAPNGVVCKQSRGKVTHDVTCTGDLPGAPPGTRVVNLAMVYAGSSGPARFLPTPPERLFGDISGQKPVLIPTGHKIVFWAFSPTESLACGVPDAASLVCVLRAKESHSTGDGPDVTNGFVITTPQSRVF